MLALVPRVVFYSLEEWFKMGLLGGSVFVFDYVLAH